MTPEQLDALAAWWRAALDAQRATLTPGGPGWADLQAKLAIVRRYEAARDVAAEVADPGFPEYLPDAAGHLWTDDRGPGSKCRRCGLYYARWSGDECPEIEGEVDTLGWVIQRLAHAHHLEHPERDGWVDSWRPER